MPFLNHKKSSSHLLERLFRHKSNPDTPAETSETSNGPLQDQHHAVSHHASVLTLSGKGRSPSVHCENVSLDFPTPDLPSLPFPSPDPTFPVANPAPLRISQTGPSDADGLSPVHVPEPHVGSASPSPTDNPLQSITPDVGIVGDVSGATPAIDSVFSTEQVLQLAEQNVKQLHADITQKSSQHKSLDKAEEKLDAVCETAEAAASPTKDIVEEVVETIRNGLDTFLEECPVLMKALDELAKIHPAIGAVVLAFKAVYGMWKTNRDNDKRVVMLHVSMKDTVKVLLSLPRERNTSVPELTRVQLEDLCRDIAREIGECANVCDLYLKKSSLVRVLQGEHWQIQFLQWVERFTNRKQDIVLVLSGFIANVGVSTHAAVHTIDQRIEELSNRLTQLIGRLTPPHELTLIAKVNEKGGIQAVIDNETDLHDLYAEETGREGRFKSGMTSMHSRHGPVAPAKYNDKMKGTGAITKPPQVYNYDFQHFREEIMEELVRAVEKNNLTFQGKYLIEQERLRSFISEENKLLLIAVNSGPHELVKDEALRTLWKDMNWRRNVKSRFFVMTLRDNLSDIISRIDNSKGDKKDLTTLLTDDWAFQYISVAYLQPIMEAFDDDGSGYTTVFEVNRFTDSLPPKITWTLPHWIAYWAIGWELVSADYCKKILEIFAHMYKMRADVLPENRDGVDYYLSQVWLVAAELTMPMASRNRDNTTHLVETKFKEYVEYEEERIKRNLQKIKYDIDASDTVYIVAGPERIEQARVRIEKHIYPLLYLLLQRDITIFHIAKTEVLHKDELWDCSTSFYYVYIAIEQRFSDLKAHFAQQKLDVDKQMKTVACGMFEYYADDGILFNMSNFATRTYDPPSTDEPPLLKFEDPKDILNYPRQDRLRLRRIRYPADNEDSSSGDRDESQPEKDDKRGSRVGLPIPETAIETHPHPNLFQRRRKAYECQAEPLTDADKKAKWHVKILLGQWNGFAYSSAYYPDSYMRSFDFHVSTKDGYDLESFGYYNGVQLTTTGHCDMDCDGIVSVTFITQYEETYCSEYFYGHLLNDGSLVGTTGYNDNPAEHTRHFILKQIPAEIMCHRPSPAEFAVNRYRSLWNFAYTAVRAQILEQIKPKDYLSSRHASWEKITRLVIRCFWGYGRSLDPDEHQALSKGLRAITTRDSNLRRLLMDWMMKIMPNHQSYQCDACSNSMAGARLICLDCQSPTTLCWLTVDLCDTPQCCDSTFTLDRFEKPHTPDHDLVKVRTVQTYRDLPDLDRRARKALQVSREIWESAQAEVSPDTDANEGVNEGTEINKEKAGEGEKRGDAHDAPNSEGSIEQDEKGDSGVPVEQDEDSHTGGDGINDTQPDTSSISETKTSRVPGLVCDICSQKLQQPCWYCVDCSDGELKLFICSTCEWMTLLQCASCKGLFKQPSWYYGSSSDDNFMCNKCNVKRIDPPTPRHTHTYTHALVRCQPKPTIPEAKSSPTLEDMVNDLTTNVGTLDTRISRLEDCLIRVESRLELLLTHLNIATAATSSGATTN